MPPIPAAPRPRGPAAGRNAGRDATRPGARDAVRRRPAVRGRFAPRRRPAVREAVRERFAALGRLGVRGVVRQRFAVRDAVRGPFRPLGRRLAAVLAAGAGALLVLAAAAPAQATGYRYWSYWLRSGGAWTYAQTGPAMHVPKDGDIEGWRFAVSQNAADQAVQPRGAADFAAICGGTASQPGHKRIALVIDPGTAADAAGGGTPPAPRTLCARVASGASSADALAAVARPLRYNSAGVLCAISGYPAAGCGDQVTTGSRSDTAGAAPAHHSGPSVGVYAGIAAVAGLGAAALVRSRRRSR